MTIELPAADENYWHSRVTRSIQMNKKRGKQEMLSLLLSILGAILVGVIMGISILSIFFSNESTYSKNSIDSHLYLPKQENTKPVQQSKPVYLLQAGIFQHRSGAEEKVRSLRKHGLAAVISAKSPYRIYLGVSFAQKDAVQLAKRYREFGINVYIRKHSIALQTNKSHALASIVQRSEKIVEELSRQSIASMSKKGSVNLQPRIEKEYRQVLAEANRRKEFLSKKERDQMLQILQSLDQAIQSANESKVNPSIAMMFQIQEGLVRYINSIEQL